MELLKSGFHLFAHCLHFAINGLLLLSHLQMFRKLIPKCLWLSVFSNTVFSTLMVFVPSYFHQFCLSFIKHTVSLICPFAHCLHFVCRLILCWGKQMATRHFPPCWRMMGRNFRKISASAPVMTYWYFRIPVARRDCPKASC